MKRYTFILLAVVAFPKIVFAQAEPHWLKTTYVAFDQNETGLNDSGKRVLDYVAGQMQASPGFRVVLEGGRSRYKPERQRNLKRIDSVLDYFTGTAQIDRSRFLLKREGNALSNYLIIRMPCNYEKW